MLDLNKTILIFSVTAVILFLIIIVNMPPPNNDIKNLKSCSYEGSTGRCFEIIGLCFCPPPIKDLK